MARDMDRAERLTEAAMAILQATEGGSLNITVLNKALYYLDLYALRDLGETVTRNTYVALEQGPVVAKYEKRLVGELERQGLAEQVRSGKARPVQIKRPLDEFHRLSEEQLRLARAAARFAEQHTSSEISDLSHGAAWQIAYDEGLGSGHAPRPVDLNMALQDIAEDDEWLDAPVGDDLKKFVDRAEGEQTFPW
jgi:hypothetical protein